MLREISFSWRLTHPLKRSHVLSLFWSVLCFFLSCACWTLFWISVFFFSQLHSLVRSSFSCGDKPITLQRPLRRGPYSSYPFSRMSEIEPVAPKDLIILSWLWVTKVTPGAWVAGKSCVVLKVHQGVKRSNQSAVAHCHTDSNNF